MRRQLIGIVTGDKRDKTRRVEVPRQYRHPRYGKIVRARTVCHVHDAENQSRLGDRVEIAECPPRSATKRWELVRVVEAADRIAVEAAAIDAEVSAEPGAAPSAPAGGEESGN
jgi:small subunit ribosomal protein S17